MGEDDYLWDRSGAADDFVAGLERKLAPLAAEAEALVDEQALLAEIEARSASRADAELVLLPTAKAEREQHREREAAAEQEAQGHGWLWMSAAAALLLAVSALVLLGEARTRREAPLQVGGGLEPSLRVEIGVEGPWGPAALSELRPLYPALAACAHGLERRAVSAEFSVVIRGAEARVEVVEVEVERGTLDDAGRRCLAQVLGRWRPQAVGEGPLRVGISID